MGFRVRKNNTMKSNFPGKLSELKKTVRFRRETEESNRNQTFQDCNWAFNDFIYKAQLSCNEKALYLEIFIILIA